MNSSLDLSVLSSRRLALGLLIAIGIGHNVVAVPLTQSSSLLVFQDFVQVGRTLNAGESLTGTFNIVNAGSGATAVMGGYTNVGETFADVGGYVPPTSLTSAKAYFYIRDANQGNDTVGLSLGGTQFFNSSAGSGNSYAILEGIADLSLLQTNGMLSYSISQGDSRASSFTVDYVQLQVVTPAGASAVPEGGMSIALLSVGLVALALIKRKNQA